MPIDNRSAARFDERIVWLDYAKGIGIILVVAGHTIRGLRVDVVGDTLTLYQSIDPWIYAFHMPLFFLISGLLVSRRWHLSVKDFFSSAMISIVVPYIIWSCAFVFAQAQSPLPVNSAVPIERLLGIWHAPILHMWYLFALFVAQVAFYGAYQCFKLKGVLFLGAFFSLLFFSGTGGMFDRNVTGLTMGVTFIFLGFLLSARLAQLSIRQASGLAVASASVFVILFLAARTSPEPGGLLEAPIAVAGVLMTIGLSLVLPAPQSFAPMAALARLGQASLAIYVSHTIFSAAARSILNSAGIHNCHLHVLLGISIGLAAPTLLYHCAIQLRIAPFVGFGPLPKKRALAAAIP